MIPQTDELLIETTDDFEEVTMSSLTYELDPLNHIVKSTKVDDIEAVKQAVYLVLNTERYEYVIYDEYGAEIKYLFGREDAYVIPELERVMTEAVLRDDRVTNVTDFKITKDKDNMLCTFTVHSIFGNFDASKEVLI